ncbi:MAG: ribosome silencing factor [Synechococcales bacterium]|nr:ribosome silencing factor [Synechococcales bacterium]
MTETIKQSVVASVSHQHSASSTEDSTYELAMLAAEAADERKGGDIALLKVGEVSVIADYFVIVTGFSKVQVRAIAAAIEEKVEEALHRAPRPISGQAEGVWICMDYGDVIVHIQMPDERDYYNLEAFWGHAERIPYIPKVPLAVS